MSDPQVRNLVFEGGGVWGIAYEGALLELEASGILEGIERIGGTSAGAIAACLMAVGYSPDGLGELMRETDFRTFKDDDLGFGRDTQRLLTEYGWYKGNTFRRWIREKIDRQTKAVSKSLGMAAPARRLTFRQLGRWQQQVAKKGVRLPALYVVGTNLSQQCREVYSPEHSPAMKVEDAVRTSMSIPLFFACARGDKHGGQRDVLVDGGLTWNYPVNVFDHKKYLSTAKNGRAIPYAKSRSHVFNSETLGFRLDCSGELKANQKDWSSEPFEIDNVLHYGWALVNFMRAIANKIHLHKNDWARTVFVDVGEDISFTDFDLSQRQKDFLSDAGREGVRKYFEWRESPEGKKEMAELFEVMAA